MRPEAAAGLGRLAGALAGLGPARAGLAAFALGALGVLAHPPFHVFPALIVSLTGLVWLMDGAAAKPRPIRAGAWRCWAFAFGYFAAGLWWVANAFIARGPDFYALIPFAVTLLPAGLALFWAAAGALSAALWPKSWRRVFLLGGALFIAEFVRGHVLTGFPWQLPAMVWSPGSPVAQSAAWIGAYGLSLVTLIGFAAPAALAGPGRRGWARGAPLAAAFLAFAALFGAGLGRLAGADPALTDTRVRLVQAAVPQDEKFLAENRGKIRDLYLELSSAPDIEHVDLVIWPETAMPFPLLEDGATLAMIDSVLPPETALAAGVFRRTCRMPGEGGSCDPNDVELHNSLAALDFSGAGVRIDALYDKAKLVPFGEFTPGGRLLTALGFRLPNIGDFSPGEGAILMETEAAPPFAPLICYEAIFPRFVPRGPRRARWMLNVSNDSWFGSSAGPAQHFAQARYRAIEEGLPLIRSAAGGVSGSVDAYGRVRASLAPDSPGVLDVSIPAPAAPTFYSRYGNLASLLLLFATAVVAVRSRALLPGVGLTKPHN